VVASGTRRNSHEEAEAAQHHPKEFVPEVVVVSVEQPKAPPAYTADAYHYTPAQQVRPTITTHSQR
jgi:hypothetical protein